MGRIQYGFLLKLEPIKFKSPLVMVVRLLKMCKLVELQLVMEHRSLVSSQLVREHN